MEQSFQPALDNDGNQISPVSISVLAASVGTEDLPLGGPDYEFTNESASGIAYIKFHKRTAAGATVTTATGLPILAGQTKVYRAPEGHSKIAHRASADCTLKVAVGRGF